MSDGLKTPPHKLAKIKDWQAANPERVKQYKLNYRRSEAGVLANRRSASRYAKTKPGRQRTAERRERIRAMVREWKNVPCADCRRRYPSVCMDFDHRPGTVKEFGISSTGMTYAIERMKAEREKCDVVCANCHRIRTAERGQWKAHAQGSWR